MRNNGDSPSYNPFKQSHFEKYNLNNLHQPRTNLNETAWKQGCHHSLKKSSQREKLNNGENIPSYNLEQSHFEEYNSNNLHHPRTNLDETMWKQGCHHSLKKKPLTVKQVT